MIQRVLATESALTLIARLQARYGELMFYQSHGCCDGSTPMLFPKGEMALNSTDIQMGEVGGVPFHVSEMQFDYLSGSQITLDVEAGSVGTFSLEDSEGVHFVARSRLWTDEEWRELSAQG
ncbi:DUF779 domain-containing protein [Derxia gummosa]|uniref:DUF779 domain-containing protein n=1 Tax=Derxia gummosa DSM 723 TaxID=1121388 RepID=A0A8B6X159_9BURK|nr:DUF779 domain-containing protein [Derxia gummosa]